MQMIDRFGSHLTGSDRSAVAHYDRAVWNLMTLSNDPVADAKAALEADPGLVMGHCLSAALLLLGTEKALLPAAQKAIGRARQTGKSATMREQHHIAALSAFAGGSFGDAARHWETLLTDNPEDALAMFCAHQCDFFLGQSSELRDRPARRLGSLDPAWPGYGFYRGMQAFGLEEMNQYAEAEAAGRHALDLCKRDTWAIHAVTHVMEMMSRVDEGAEFLRQRSDDWAVDNFFQCHNWWHLSLYMLDRQDFDGALGLYDEKIKGGESTTMLDMIDASALLWRLTLHGADVGGRWTKLAAIWEPRINDGWYSFNDVHAVMAFAAAGEHRLLAKLLARMERAIAGQGEYAEATRLLGLPAAKAMAAHVEGRFGDAVELLLPLRAIAARVGGSNAQRDVLNQTLIRAAEQAGQKSLAVSLLNERQALKPKSNLTRLWRERALRAYQQQ